MNYLVHNLKTGKTWSMVFFSEEFARQELAKKNNLDLVVAVRNEEGGLDILD